MLRKSPHHVVAIAYPGMAPFELAIAVEVFGLNRPEVDVERWYDIEVCAVEPGPQPAVGGFSITVHRGLDALETADTIIAPGWPVDVEPPAVLVDAIRAAHTRGARVVSICSGAFLLASTGLLDGHRAATHWRHADRMRKQFPAVDVDPTVLYVDDDRVLTSAGSAAGIDLCLHIVRRDHGVAIANKVARRLVVAAHRDGGQAQFIERPIPAITEDRIHRVIAWMDEHISENMTLPSLAARAHLSERQFTRRFRAATGESPTQWTVRTRIELSLELLESSAASVDQIASTVGFASTATFRHHFIAQRQVSPSRYRRSFAS